MATTVPGMATSIPGIVTKNLHRNGLAAWLLFRKTLDESRDLGAAALAPLFDNMRLYFRRYWLVPGAEFAIR
jgi:hypothetical protein